MALEIVQGYHSLANLQDLDHRCFLFAMPVRQRSVRLSPGGDRQMERCPPRKRWVENIHGMNDRLRRPTATVHLRAEIDVDVKWGPISILGATIAAGPGGGVSMESGCAWPFILVDNFIYW